MPPPSAKACASSEFFKNGVYDYTIFEGDKGTKRTADEQIDYLEYLINNTRLTLLKTE